jgi:hypothetical protein
VGGRSSKIFQVGTASVLLVVWGADLLLRPTVSFPQGKGSERTRMQGFSKPEALTLPGSPERQGQCDGYD